MRDPASKASSGHRVVIDWMGSLVETLQDLLRPGLAAVCIGINPEPESGRVGHYYQGTLGRRFFDRLRSAGVLPIGEAGWDDDVAFARGIGFTDVVKRPTKRATDIRSDEYAHGRPMLELKLTRAAPRLVIFSFKSAAEKLVGSFAGNGFLPRIDVCGAEVFVIAGTIRASRHCSTSALGAASSPDDVVRTVTENAKTLKFREFGFDEVDGRPPSLATLGMRRLLSPKGDL